MKTKLVVLITLLAMACSDKDKKGKLLDSPTTGTIKVAIDESLKPLFEAEIDGFHSLYQYAHITADYTSESKAIEDLLKDSARVAVVTRKFDTAELNYIHKLQIKETQVLVAKEAIALIVNKENPDSLITWKQLNDILKGNVEHWNQLYQRSKLGDLQVVFDHPQSGIVRYLTDTLGLNKLPAFCFGVNTNAEVFDHVAKTKNAIGLIGLSWISDKDDPAANHFLKDVTVMGILTDEEYLKPYKAYIAMKKYPLSRNVYMLSKEARSGLGSGFITYVASDKGQRIILKSGLVPAKAPVRLVQINQQSLNDLDAK